MCIRDSRYLDLVLVSASTHLCLYRTSSRALFIEGCHDFSDLHLCRVDVLGLYDSSVAKLDTFCFSSEIPHCSFPGSTVYQLMIEYAFLEAHCDKFIISDG